jgi:RNA polymerase sigma factor (sigma-70 family)
MKLREAHRRHAATAKRSVRREITRGLRAETSSFCGSGLGPVEKAISREENERAQQAIELLPGTYRRVLRLLRQERVSLREAGRRMGRSPEAVRKLCARAICRFREIYEELSLDDHA